MSKIDMDVIQRAYAWTLSAEGEVYGLVAGDMGYEPTGIVVDADTMKACKMLVAQAEAERDEQRKRANDLEAQRGLMLTTLKDVFDFIAKYSVGNPYLSEPAKAVVDVIRQVEGGQP
jgi:hypothetical protein